MSDTLRLPESHPGQSRAAGETDQGPGVDSFPMRSGAHRTLTGFTAVALNLALLATPSAAAENLAAVQDLHACLTLKKEAGVAACQRALGHKLSPKRTALARSVLALNLAGLGRWEEVVQVYTAMANDQPDNPETQLRLGEALLYGQGRAEEALLHLRLALNLAPNLAQAHGSCGVALNSLGRHSESVGSFEQAERLDPGYFGRHPAQRLAYEAAREGQVWPLSPRAAGTPPDPSNPPPRPGAGQ